MPDVMPESYDGPNEAQATYLNSLLLLAAGSRRHYRLLIAILAVFMLLGLVIVAVSKPAYTAVAIIGPPSSTLDSMTSLTAGLGSTISRGLGKKFGIGGGGGSGDVFDQYQSLLTSNRIASVLASDQNVLHAMFPAKYDWERGAWKTSGGPLSGVKRFLKSVLHMPVKSHPDKDDVSKYLKRVMTIDAPLTSNFVTITVTEGDPNKAEWLLNTVLSTADSVIREDKRRDVTARIRYLVNVLPSITQTDQKQSLSDVLSQQQQNMMMVAADKRYASALVDPPHASLIPTSPNVSKVLGFALLLGFGVWVLLVMRLPESHRLLKYFSQPIWRRVLFFRKTS
jgi:uncharacterized protein involved in exopolysaccharide biosynthesis